jgi:S-adenosyl methyltransferase
MAGLLYFVAEPYEPLRTLVDRLSEGSYLALSHLTAEHRAQDDIDEAVKVYQNATEQLFPRSRAEIERLFDGLEFVPPYKGADPGLSYIGLWGADDPVEADDDTSRIMYAGVAVKPPAED